MVALSLKRRGPAPAVMNLLYRDNQFGWLIGPLAFSLLLVLAACSNGDVRPTSSGVASLSCPDCSTVPVSRVIDGDTFDSGATRIRLFGVDTPERGERCFNEATNRLKELAGDVVRVEQGPRTSDTFDRMLYYVYTKDGKSIDELLVREGLAVAWRPDGQHRQVMVSLEEYAHRNRAGCLWK